MNFKEFKQLFLDLTKVTVPYGSEYLYYHGFMKHLIDFELCQRGENFYCVVGDESVSKTLFCAHLDTAGLSPSGAVVHKMDGDTIFTDGTSLLGADDKAGVATLIYLIEHKVPGTYYFFAGEEEGGIGSSNAASRDRDFFMGFERAIAFDRRGQCSIVSKQRGVACCSNPFVRELSAQFSRENLTMVSDPRGTFTDTASFLDIIPECTNISIGYHHEHSTRESLEIDYTFSVARAAAQIDWEGLPADRVPEPTESTFHKA